MKKRQLGDRFPKIEGIGCFIRRRKLGSTQIVSLFERDLQKAQELSCQDPTGYFSRKAGMIESAARNYSRRVNGRFVEVGYGPGLKYVYPGLPVEFAQMVDPAIRDVVDLIATCRGVAMTGLCCSGHPSAAIRNPGILDNPRFAAINRMNSAMGETIFSHNHNPYLKLLIARKSILPEKLSGIIGTGKGMDAEIEITAHRIEHGLLHKGFPLLVIRGFPRLKINGQMVRFMDFVQVYQKALQDFWARIQEVFLQVGGIDVPKPRAEHFIASPESWEFESGLLEKRVSEGLSLPNYCYFFGRGSTAAPEFMPMKERHHL